ncbi:MAG: hypothetical protein RXR20_21675 [Paraburkholderia sp.]|jgi:hypothetical protein|uniref:hypothetical protein n=1 Tax=Burkholderiaceae TaxID=119060 RepID=UPI0010F55C70|nr:hypothetical protein [Burkholderia sp. 4M9327F10]
MIPSRCGRRSRFLHTLSRAAQAAFLAAAANIAMAAAPADPASQTPAPTCSAEVAGINSALQNARQPALCERCAARLAQTLGSLYANGVLPNFYRSADGANWDDPQRRPSMLSGLSLAHIGDGKDFAADIDSGYGPRGVLRLRYSAANQPLDVTTDDHRVSIPVTYCTSSDTR